MTIKVAIIGVGGRLGSTIAREVIADDRFDIAGGVVRADSDHFERDIGEIAGGDWIGKQTAVRLEDAVAEADVVIDASTPGASAAIAQRLADLGGPALLCGVTGLQTAAIEELTSASRTLPVLTARNFSIGIALVEMLVSTAAVGLPQERWDAEISETHHRFKADAPSGTALLLGESVAKAREQVLDMVSEPGRSGTSAQRRPGAIGFSSMRGGAVIGEHDVRFLSSHEEITISHRALDRRVFALGALTAAAWIIDKAPGLYSMRDVIGVSAR